MKKTALLLTLLLLVAFAKAQVSNSLKTGQPILATPKVDKRIELLSIVFRLAECEEYSQDLYKKYVDDIHRHFDQYKNHPLIAYIKDLRESNGIAYDRVMNMAVYLTQPPELKPVVPFSNKIPDEDWTKPKADKFVTLLRKFYTDAQCDNFFKAEETVYHTVEEKSRIIYDSLDLTWYSKFYGSRPNGKFEIIIGVGNGGANYGPKVVLAGKTEVLYAILGTWLIDSLGQPYYSVSKNLPTLIHEFNHSFINTLTYRNQKALEVPGKLIFGQLKTKMKKQAYAEWQTMISEALVRACVIKYLQAHDPTGKRAKEELAEQLGNGFIWMKELVDLLDVYENQRQKYPTLVQFMPQIISFYTATAKNFDNLSTNYEKSCPHIASIEPFKNGAHAVDPSIKEIKIWFDKPLAGKGYSILYGDKGKDHYPKFGKIAYSDNNMAVTIETELKPGMDYQFVMSGMSFKTPDGYALADSEINFKTR